MINVFMQPQGMFIYYPLLAFGRSNFTNFLTEVVLSLHAYSKMSSGNTTSAVSSSSHCSILKKLTAVLLFMLSLSLIPALGIA